MIGIESHLSGSQKKVGKIRNIANDAILIKATVRGPSSISLVKSEAELIEELSRENCPYIVSPYLETVHIVGKNQKGKVVLIGTHFQGCGEDVAVANPLVMARIFGNLAEALTASTRLGWIYHDLKPENFLITNIN